MMCVKKIVAVVLASVLVASAAVTASASPINFGFTEAHYRIIFVVDYSGSMNFHDSENKVAEMMKMLIDALYSQNVDIAIVGFTDVIKYKYPFTSIDDRRSRQRMKRWVDTRERRGWTDVGFALNYAMNMFIDDPKPNSKPVIILFSDGGTDLRGTATGRTLADSRAYEAEAFRKSELINCPIHTVGISRDGTLEAEFLRGIADATNGRSYLVQSASALTSVFRRILSDLTGIDVHLKSEPLTGGLQSIHVDILGCHADEVNIILHHEEGAVTGLTCENSDYEVYASRLYTSIKLPNPRGETAALSFTGTAGSRVEINTVNYITVEPRIELRGNNLAAHEIPIYARVFSPGAPAAAALHEGMTAELVIRSARNGTSETIAMEHTGNAFVYVYRNDYPDDVEFYVTMRDMQNNEIVTDVKAVSFINNPPRLTQADMVALTLESMGQHEIDLDDYFHDVDGGVLEFYLVSGDGQALIKNGSAMDARIEGNKLLLTPKAAWNGFDATDSFTVLAADGRGGAAELTFALSIPLLVYYRGSILIAAAAFAAVLGLVVILVLRAAKKKKPVESAYKPLPRARFNGAKLEGYFHTTLSGNEIPTLYWNAAYIENKSRTSLGGLFDILEVEEELPEAEKIYFEAGHNNRLVFYHDTACIVTAGKLSVAKGRKVVLGYNEKIFIVFEDNVTEIEVRYKRANRV